MRLHRISKEGHRITLAGKPAGDRYAYLGQYVDHFLLLLFNDVHSFLYCWLLLVRKTPHGRTMEIGS